MTVDEVVTEVSYNLGLSTTKNVDDVSLETAVQIAFRELKRYMTTPVNKTVPFATRIQLRKAGIFTKKVLYVQAAQPRIGLTLSSIDSGNVFQIAAAVNTYSAIGNSSSLNIDPIMTEMAMAQVRNTLGTDYQWVHDPQNDVLYCVHRDPRPSQVTIRYVPDFQDVSEIIDPTWIDYLVRLSAAHAKLAIGHARSKYTVQDSNVETDGQIMLDEGNAELEKIREELEGRKRKLVVLN